ncbi:PLC-like phosphodiesterase [Globomyces pollinis-pini]|nr:PLC-like phosphodiesterase [Globomyces pollinis-pini]
MIFNAITLILVCQAVAISLSTWMAEKASVIGGRRLNEIDIPGAHHAGYLSVPWYNALPGLWTICQSDSITVLLNKGVRYLDLRIAERDNTIFFSHTLLSKQKLDDALVSIQSWIKQNAGEILILDFVIDGDYKDSNTNNALKALPNKLQNMFGDLKMTKSDYSSLNYSQLVAKNKRIAIVGDSQFNTENIPITDSWGVTKDGNWGNLINKCMDYIKSTNVIKNGGISSISAAVTPAQNNDYSYPEKVAPDTNRVLAQVINAYRTGRLGVIEVDFVQTELALAVINHNDVN